MTRPLPRKLLRPGWWSRIGVIAHKELYDHFRDRRSLVLGLVYPLLGPLLLAGSLYVAGGILTAANQPASLTLPAKGIEHAPEFVGFLADLNLHLMPVNGSLAEIVRRGEAPLGFDIPAAANSGERFTLRLFVDFSNLNNLQISQQVANIIAAYNHYRARELARAVGLSEEFLLTVAVDQVSVSRPASIGTFLFNLMPPLIMFMVFLAAVHVSIDMTVGERERGSLEPLLITPVERSGMLLAKALVGFLMTALTMAINLIGFRIFLGIASGAFEHMSAPPGLWVFVSIYLICIPLMVLAVALQVTIAIVSRSMKEAQIYLGLLPLVPALPGMILVFSPMRPSETVALIPMLGQLSLFNQLIGGESVAVAHVLIASLVALALALLMFWRAARLFQHERMLFAT